MQAARARAVSHGARMDASALPENACGALCCARRTKSGSWVSDGGVLCRQPRLRERGQSLIGVGDLQQRLPSLGIDGVARIATRVVCALAQLRWIIFNRA